MLPKHAHYQAVLYPEKVGWNVADRTPALKRQIETTADRRAGGSAAGQVAREEEAHCRRCASPVVDRALLARAELGHRAVVAVGLEDRIVAETAVAGGQPDDPTLARPPLVMGLEAERAGGVDQGEHDPIAGPSTVIRNTL